LAVATREIPELCNLADDPSNDGQIFKSQAQTPLCSEHHAENEKTVLPPRTITFAHIEPLSCTSFVLSSTGREILRLVGSLRT
jgi:hypothetical protein